VRGGTAEWAGRPGKGGGGGAAAVAWAVGSAVGITIRGGAVEECGAAEGEAGPDTDPES